MKEPPIHDILDTLIGEDACFAVYRLPNENSLRFVLQQSGNPATLSDFDALGCHKGFVIAPFRISHSSPLLVIRPDWTSLSALDLSGIQLSTSPMKPSATFSHEALYKSGDADKALYSRLFERFHKPLVNDEMKKLVLSRNRKIERPDNFSAGQAFLRATSKYPHSYVYLFHTPQTGTWLGSTPEMLLTGSKEEWHTVALAGTRYPNGSDVTWDDKNLREQHLVSSYILKQLSGFQIANEMNGPYTIKAGNLAHLRTDFSFAIRDKTIIGKLLKSLHPTPAVSGLPKEEAYQFINEHEEQDRQYYSGFLGMLDPEDETSLYVNLRCMRIGKKSLTLFAGGGLLASSSLENEWEETEHKLRTMLHIVE